VQWKARTSPPPPPFVGPKTIHGPPARGLREGALQEAGIRPGTVEAIDSVLSAWADDSDQAFAVCIARRGVIVLHKAYGMRDGQPMTVTTKSWMASITKPMSATLMMMLVDDGRVSLDDRITDLLPRLRGLPNRHPITIRNLYTHTHGLEFYIPKGQDELADFEERVADCYPFARAGREWVYNGVGYTVGGKVIETLTGEALPDFYRAHLLGPLGCEDTEVSGTHADARSIPLDMAKFAQMLLNGGAYGDKRFFRKATFQQMLPQRLLTVLGPNAKKVFGIGLDGTDRSFGHGAASAATFKIDLDDELVVVMTRNAVGKNYEKYNGKFWAALEGGIIR